jgi:peroxiredoxin
VGPTAEGFDLGDEAPDFELPDTEGTLHSLVDAEGAPATVVIWTCNHCPYALAWHDRLADVAREYGQRGVRFLAVNSNDAERYPADSYEAMQQRVAAEDWPLPYLHDESQEVARAWGAEVTPHVFVLDSDRRLRYHGAPDPDYKDPGHRASWLRAALDQVLADEDVARAATEPVGCTVKWKQ